jgi:hypothetical protein
MLIIYKINKKNIIYPMIQLKTFGDLNIGDSITYQTVDKVKVKKIIEINKTYAPDYVTIKTNNDEEGDIIIFPKDIAIYNNRYNMVYPTDNNILNDAIHTTLNMFRDITAQKFNNLFGDIFLTKNN